MKAHHVLRHLTGGPFHSLAELGSARTHPPRDARDAAHRLAGALGAVAKAHDLVVTVRGEVPRGVALIVPNHVSYLDPIAILPVGPAIPIVTGELASWPIIGPIGAARGVAYVTRRDRIARVRVLRRMHDLLAAGVPVLNFAEGTTTDGTRVLPLWRGGFGIAQRLEVPVVPVAIRYRDPSLAWVDRGRFIPHYLRMAALPRIEVEVTFGNAMLPRAGEPPEAMAMRARQSITAMLEPRTSVAAIPLTGNDQARRRRRVPQRAA
ncbi:MAG: lysophospholipid acyltransferase family protein [Kofleriaceae bacterium]